MDTNHSAASAGATRTFNESSSDIAPEVLDNQDVARQSLSPDDNPVTQEQLQQMFGHFLSGWASDVLNLRNSGGDRFTWQRAA